MQFYATGCQAAYVCVVVRKIFEPKPKKKKKVEGEEGEGEEEEGFYEFPMLYQIKLTK